MVEPLQITIILIIFQIFTPPHGVRGRNNMPSYKDKNTNTWYCKFYYTNWLGEKKQKLKRGFDRKKDAQDWERNFLDQFATNPDITFQALYEKYKRFKENRIKATTFENQCAAIDLHILPHFKDRIISDITPADIIEWQNSILEKDFAASYSRQLNAYLRAIFKYAVDYLGLSRNPVKSTICKPERSKIDLWTPEEYKTFSDGIKSNIELYTAFEILYYTGMRKGELLALTLQDVDFDQKTITINKTLVYVGGSYQTQTPKTKRSNRVIDVPEFLLDEIRDYISHLYKLDPEQRLFMRHLSWLGCAINRNCGKLGLKVIRVHDLRHSHASVLINLGANPLMIADRLGHENVQMTLNTYSHLFESHQKEIIEKLEKIKF